MSVADRIKRGAFVFGALAAATGLGAAAMADQCGGKQKSDGASSCGSSCASSCASACGSAQKASVVPDQVTLDLVDVAVGAGSFKTLVSAVQAAGLVEVLKGEGPFTVFAPSDEAFAKLPAGMVEALLKDKDKAKLAGILTYHIVPGKLSALDVAKLKSARTVQGTDLAIGMEKGEQGVTINGAHLLQTDIPASNGVIHVIDTVMLPEGIL